MGIRTRNEDPKSAEVRGLENEMVSLRTQMRLQQVQARDLAYAVIELFPDASSPSAKKAVELATAILA